MKVVYGRHIGNLYVKMCGYAAANVLGVAIYAHPKYSAAHPLSAATVRHEEIHQAQMRELWYVGMWALTAYYFVRDLVRYRKLRAAYRSSPFEHEAYMWMYQSDYLSRRKPYAWREFTNVKVESSHENSPA